MTLNIKITQTTYVQKYNARQKLWQGQVMYTPKQNDQQACSKIILDLVCRLPIETVTVSRFLWTFALKWQETGKHINKAKS